MQSFIDKLKKIVLEKEKPLPPLNIVTFANEERAVEIAEDLTPNNIHGKLWNANEDISPQTLTPEEFNNARPVNDQLALLYKAIANAESKDDPTLLAAIESVDRAVGIELRYLILPKDGWQVGIDMHAWPSLLTAQHTDTLKDFRRKFYKQQKKYTKKKNK